MRLPGKGYSTSHGARPVHRIIPMMKRGRCFWATASTSPPPRPSPCAVAPPPAPPRGVVATPGVATPDGGRKRTPGVLGRAYVLDGSADLQYEGERGGGGFRRERPRERERERERPRDRERPRERQRERGGCVTLGCRVSGLGFGVYGAGRQRGSAGRLICWERVSLQGYLTHKKGPTPPRTIIGLWA